MRNLKKTRYLLTKWKLCEEKNHSGAAKPRNSTIQKQSKLQSTRTHKTHCCSHTFNYNMKPIVNASQPVSYLKGSLMDSFTLGPTPKIDFTRTIEHTLATARELADLQFSLNTLSKHYEIRYRIHAIYKPRALYL
jgi:hypothetical protein